MLEWPRSAFVPPPGMPMLPRRSWIIAIERTFWEPTECCVQPSAYRLVIVLSRALVRDHSQILTNWSLGVPVISETFSGV